MSDRIGIQLGALLLIGLLIANAIATAFALQSHAERIKLFEQHSCRCKLPQIFIDENTDIPNNPLKPLTPEEFQKLLDELRKRSKPEVGDGL